MPLRQVSVRVFAASAPSSGLFLNETKPQWGACMALSRAAVLLLLLPVPAAVYLAASMEDVNASSQCLPSAEAVRQQYPGSWASWTTHAANHKGEKCWYPAMRENHARHIETMLHRAAQTLMRKEAQHHESGGDKAGAEAPVLFAADVNALGWSFRTRSAKMELAGVSDETAKRESSFDDRFAAARDATSVQKPSVIQRMMDPVGAIPIIP
jgi:hypothetical protein